MQGRAGAKLALYISDALTRYGVAGRQSLKPKKGGGGKIVIVHALINILRKGV